MEAKERKKRGDLASTWLISSQWWRWWWCYPTQPSSQIPSSMNNPPITASKYCDKGTISCVTRRCRDQFLCPPFRKRSRATQRPITSTSNHLRRKTPRLFIISWPLVDVTWLNLQTANWTDLLWAGDGQWGSGNVVNLPQPWESGLPSTYRSSKCVISANRTFPPP